MKSLAQAQNSEKSLIRLRRLYVQSQPDREVTMRDITDEIETLYISDVPNVDEEDLLELIEEEDDEEEERLEEEEGIDIRQTEEQQITFVDHQDLICRRLSAIKAVVKKLITESSTDETGTESRIQKHTPRNISWITEEYRVITLISDQFAPYFPKYGKLQKHPALLLPFMTLCNAIFRLAGYGKLTRSVHPVVSPSAEQTLHLDETSIYELFGSSFGMYQFVS
ncbi:uncharacterized protein BYT42DRAFT_619821 [Radiomyces spectabilis]|uniref:uncharacterized protein n=1 Tax=Radiomyces spectabilis TaxID=64574 RepID=UPI002220EB62|nr:uncharacterized protein BYT42DRAFT_619821 [Radiomyces spectabilis]KAI8393675.1 hypothetical protein BYT42DRAFT_619821 [Radiomyces spectabilis]